MSTVSTPEDLAGAMGRGESRIIVEGDLANGVVKIHLVGPIAWGICIIAIGAAVAIYFLVGGAAGGAAATTAATTAVAGTHALTFASAATGGLAAVGAAGAAAVSGGAALAILGGPATATAIAIAVAAGGTGVLTTLRSKYRIVEKSYNRVVLVKK
jgi:hypothetical protein